MINSTLTLNNFFVLRLRDPNPFDSGNLDAGNSFNLKNLFTPPLTPHGHNLENYFFAFFILKKTSKDIFCFILKCSAWQDATI